MSFKIDYNTQSFVYFYSIHPTFMSLNRIIESYQMELIDEYENYKQTIIVQDENSRTQFLKDRAKLENDISSLEGRKYY
ncbi:hypothetical protein D5F81_00740 [Streptococcus agalactiae]|nr:hypothetical protein D5F81_00740 [Streptococcus agalactiae]